VSGFSTEWLAQREPFDRAARAQSIAVFDALGRLAELRTRTRAAHDQTLHVIDLACGTGANLRELAPRLGGRQRWQVVDHDGALLSALPAELASWAHASGHQLQVAADRSLTLRGAGFDASIACQQLDLATQLDRLPWDQTQLVTASALLDLVSADWLAALVRHCSHAGAAMWFALTVDGRCDWLPADADDTAVLRLFAAHQQRDKGFGAALGAAAATWLIDQAEGAGFQVVAARSDWLIDADGGADHRTDTRTQAMAIAMQHTVVEGIAAAAIEQTAFQQRMVQRWRARRLTALVPGRLQLGHLDVLALPPTGRPEG
jgi:GNAT superfamily N-acetyltransferase